MRVIFVLSTQNIYRNGDAAYYHYQANLLATGHGFIEPYTWNFYHQAVATAYHPPVWILYLSAFSLVGLNNTLAGLILAHTVLSVPYVLITVLATLQTFDRNLLKAAATLGAPPQRRFSPVTMDVFTRPVA